MNLKWSSAARSVMRATRRRAADRIAVLVDELHLGSPFRRRVVVDGEVISASTSSVNISPIICSDARASCASSSSIFDMAKPTWISTQSPGTQVLVLEQADVDHPADSADVDPSEVLVLTGESRRSDRGCRGTCQLSFSATISTRTVTSGCTLNIRIRGGSIPKSRMSNVDLTGERHGAVVDGVDGHRVLVACGSRRGT